MTTLGFKDVIDLPDFRQLAPSPATSAAGLCLASDMVNSEDRHPFIYEFASSTVLNAWSIKSDDWIQLSSPGMGGTFGAGSACVFASSQGPRGTLASGWTSTVGALTTALPATVGVNQLANRGDGVGYKIRIIGNASGASSGKVEERTIVSNTGGTTPTITLDSALTFTPASGDAYEILSGRVYLLNAGTLGATSWRTYDIATNSYISLSQTNLPGTIGTDSELVSLDELYVPNDKVPGLGFYGLLTATATGATTITGQVAGADSSLVANEYRNFQIRIVEDTTNKTAVGQRVRISSHTGGASPVYTIPGWIVTPSATAKYVIEGNNDVIAITTAATTIYTYNITGNAWSTTTFGARGSASGAGCSALWGFGYQPDTQRNARHSLIYCFRGGATNSLDILDIAGGANGLWTNGVVYGNQTATYTFTIGTSWRNNPVTQNGRYAYCNLNGGQRILRFDMVNRVMEPWCYLRYSQGAAVVGTKMGLATFFDGATKLALLCVRRSTGAEFFQTMLQR